MSARRTYTDAEIEQLPAVIPAAVADAVLGISYRTGRELRTRGAYPVRVLHLGRLDKIATRSLLDYLEGREPAEVLPGPAAPLRAVAGGDGGR